MKRLAIALALAVSQSVAHAEDLNLAWLDGPEQNRAHVSTGAEYGFTASAGYSRIVPFLDRQIVLGGEATLPWASFDTGDYRVRASILAPIVGTTHWKLAGALSPTLRGTSNKISDMTNLGFDATLLGGYYARRAFIALESGVDFALATHVSHTDKWRGTAYMDAKDGWYSNGGANLRGGIQAGLTVDRYDIILRAGQVRDSAGDPPLIPFYGTLTLNARW